MAHGARRANSPSKASMSGGCTLRPSCGAWASRRAIASRGRASRRAWGLDYPYLLGRLCIERPNQAWPTDITYVPMAPGFLSLMATLDIASRKMLAWRLSNTLTTDFCLAALEEALARLDAAGRRPKFIYTIPNFQNPAGVTMSLQRRRRLVEIARERELLVLEDNPYGMLRYEGDALPTLRALEGPTGAPGENDFVIYAGTMSKILSPGVRVGWLAAPRPLLAKLVLGKQSTDLCSSALAQHFVAAYFACADWRPYVETLCDLYHRRRDVILDALAEHLPPEATWTRP
ncbi:MAG: aminotransferase class I/II-fold pyridoxal phosphate-dependent enzyme, partial [Deltaproteobacteria bacterium]|nr:aminotransferase class I/II-fold pyridoxal phosphate-dependent enzyme [Deltaproteobacteria bacterium]